MCRIFLSFLLLFNVSVWSQNNSIATNETLTYTATYNMSGILTDIAQVTMETSEVNTSKSTLLRLKCKATTFSKWDNFFKVRDLYESYVNPKTLTPYLYKRDINEGGYYKFMQYKYSHKTKTVKSLMKKRRSDGSIYEENKDVKFNSGTKDIVATLYYLRTLDIHKASPGASDSFNVLFDNIEYKVTFTYLKKEAIQTAIGQKECYKLAISLSDSNLLKGNSDNLIWLTADENKIPVYAKFKIPVGNGELKIKSATGLKH